MRNLRTGSVTAAAGGQPATASAPTGPVAAVPSADPIAAGAPADARAQGAALPAAAPPAGDQPAPAAAPSRADDERAFADGLADVINRASATDESVFVFRFRGCLIGLQQWSDALPMADHAVDEALEALILELAPDVTVLRTEQRDILGYNREPQSRTAAERLGGRLVAGLTTVIGDPGREFVVSPRLGVAIIDRYDGSAEQAIEAASRTLQQTNFDTPYLVHNDFIRDRSTRQEHTRDELPVALAEGQISLEFQPRVDASTDVPIGLEVYPRWIHPERGSILTIEFLQVAERNGMLVDLGNHVRLKAVEQAAIWQRDRVLASRRLWLNVAPVELCHPDLIDGVQALTERFPGVLIGFEIRDSRLLEDPVFARIFDQLHRVGVALALDNVRSSSLSIARIRRLPTSAINLDGELIRSLPSRAANRDLVRLLCSYAAAEGKRVTACEVETQEQLELVRSLGIESIQGLAAAAPMSAADAEALLRERPAPGSGLFRR